MAILNPNSVHFELLDEAEKCAYCFMPAARRARATGEVVCENDVATYILTQGIPEEEVYMTENDEALLRNIFLPQGAKPE